MGICGFGWSAQEFHLLLARATGCIDLVAVYDPILARRELAASAGATVLATESELETSIRAEQIDVVLISSPSAMHVAHAEAAMKGGAHVIVEKPVAQSAAEFRQLLALADEHGRVVIPFHNRVFDHEHQLVKEVLATGAVGRLLSIDATVATAAPPVRHAAPEFRPLWRLEGRYGGGVLADWGPHKIEQMVDYLGPGVISDVAARSRRGIWSRDCDDVTDAFFEWGGVHVRLLLTYIERIPRERLRVVGTTGTLRVVGSDKAGDIEVSTESGVQRWTYSNRVSDWQPLYTILTDVVLRNDRDAATPLRRRAAFVYETIDRIRDAARVPGRIRRRTLTIADKFDDPEWDTLVGDAPGGTIFHSSAWWAASRRRCLRLGIRDARGIVAGLLVEEPADDGLRSLAPYAGPILSVSALDEGENLLTRLAEVLAEQLRACMFITSPWAPSLRAFVTSGVFRAKLLYSAVVNIADLDATFAAFNSELRRNIRAAERTLVVDDGDGGILELLDLVACTFDRQQLPLWFDAPDAVACFEGLLRRDRARMFLARDATGTPVSGVAVAWDLRRAYYVAGGYDSQRAHRGGTSLALWHAMQFVRTQIGLQTFDLEGSHLPAIERFFRQFGANWLPYYVVKREVGV